MTELDVYEQKRAERKAEREQSDREAVAMLKAESLMAQWDTVCVAEHAKQVACKNAETQRNRYTQMLAEALNVTIGMRVIRTRHRYGNQPPRTQTFEVTRFALYSPTVLTLWGRTIRKDGKLGEVFDIGTDWERPA